MKSRFRLVVITILALALGGCVRVDVGGTHEPTLGRQIMDLYQAKQSGAISDKEWKRLQLKILTSGG